MAETTSRVLSLLGLLQTHRQWTGPELSSRLGVTDRTLRRDVERLRDLGYRIDTTRGSTGGYRLEAGSELPPLLMTADEAVTMAVGLRLAASAGIAGEETSFSALAKLEQLLPPELRERVNATAGITRRSGPDRASIPRELLGRLALAARDSERIRFRYTSADGSETSRVVEPHTLVSAERAWFLVAFDLNRNDWRTFRIDRISDYFGTRLAFTPRTLPVASAADLVSPSARTGRLAVDIRLSMPVERAKATFGHWADGATAIDESTTLWPVRADDASGILSALLWIPADVGFEISEPTGGRRALAEARALLDQVGAALGTSGTGGN